jgi:hypothetical protein
MYPITIPNSSPASFLSKQRILLIFKSVPGFANFKIVINTTTATPSLNKDSPAILVSNDFDTYF